MNGFRSVLLFTLPLAASLCVASDWTVVILNPTGVLGAEGLGGAPGQQVGRTDHGNFVFRAALWTGTAQSYVSLHPSGAEVSSSNATSGTKQGGYARFAGQDRAGLWSGTAASWISLHPAAAEHSWVNGIEGTKQVGVAIIDGQDHAAIWSGTAASWLDITPAGSSSSDCYSIYGTKQFGDAVFAGVLKGGMWSGTAASWISLHPAGVSQSSVICGNATRQGGFVGIGNSQQAALWSGTAGSYVNINPAGASDSYVIAMLGDTQVGHRLIGGAIQKACLWKGTAASMVDLHAYLPANYEHSLAKAIFTDGSYEYIVGSAATTSQESKAIMWVRSILVPFTFTLNKASVAGQNSVQGTVTLGEAQATPTVFTTYDNSSLVTTPASVTVASGTLVKNFQITVMAVTSQINTTIYCRLGTVTQSKPLTLTPLVPTALSFTPNPVTGGQTTTAKVVINGVAGPGGRTIALFDNSPNATTPSSVVVPAGANQVTFPISTTTVSAQKVVTVTARVSAGEKTGTFRINP